MTKPEPPMQGGNTSGLPIPEEPGTYDGQPACMDPEDPERVTHEWMLGAWREVEAP